MFYRLMHHWRMKQLAALWNQSDRNLRKVKTTVMKKLDKLVYQALLRRQMFLLSEDEQAFLTRHGIPIDRIVLTAMVFCLPLVDREGNEKDVIFVTEELIRLILETEYQL